MCSQPLMSHAVMVRGPSLQLDSRAKLVGCRASSRRGKSLANQSAPLARVGMPRDVTRSKGTRTIVAAASVARWQF